MEFIGEIGRKIGDATLLAVEAEKSRRAAQIGLESGLFRVPEVVNFDQDAGILEFEYVRNLITFSDMVTRALPAHEELAERAGRALARIHQQLCLDDLMRIPLPQEWTGDHEGDVFLHGDFTANNVCVDEKNMELVIVDWSAAPFVGRMATIGPGLFDVICFARHLIMGAPWAKTLKWPGTSLCDLFILGYVDDNGAPIDHAIWQRYQKEMMKFSRCTIRDRLHHTSLLSKPGKALCQLALYQAWRSYRPPPRSFIQPIT